MTIRAGIPLIMCYLASERIRLLIDTGHYVCGIFIDLDKAFYMVNNRILCDKLNYYGLLGNVNLNLYNQTFPIEDNTSQLMVLIKLWCTPRFITGDTIIPSIH